MADRLRTVMDGLMDVIASFFVRILYFFNGQL